MVLPDWLRSKYYQYKNDTSIIASWIANTAKSLGYQDAKPSNGSTPTPAGAGAGSSTPANSGRPKGKGRKGGGRGRTVKQAPSIPSAAEILAAAEEMARKAEGERAPPSSARNGANGSRAPSYVLQIKDFIPMARHIVSAEAEPAVEVPPTLSAALSRVIWARKAFARQMGSKADRKHSFFVQVLERVQDTLKPLLSGSESGSDALDLSDVKKSVDDIGAAGQDDKPKARSSVFEFLDVYEPSEEFLNAPDVVLPERHDASYQIEEVDERDEAIFAFMTLLGDFAKLRDEVRALWDRYSAKELDLAAVSVATNAAMEFARNMEEDIAPLLKRVGGSEVVAQNCHFALCEAAGHDFLAKRHPGDDFNYDAYEVGNLDYHNALLFTRTHWQHNAPKALSQYNGKWGWYNERRDFAPATGKARWLQQKNAMAEFLSDNLYFVEFFEQPVQDELIRGMRKIRETGVTPISYAFAVQLYLDVLQHQRLTNPAGVDRAYTEMRETIVRIKTSLGQIPVGSKPRREALRAVTLWEGDPIHQARTMLHREELLERPHSAPWTFLRHHPMYCGLWVHYMRTRFHTEGNVYSAVPGAVMAVGQLYHAVRQEGALPEGRRWEDMETFMQWQGNSTFFVGDPPTSPEGYAKNFMLTMGMSTTNWAPNKRTAKVDLTQATRRNMRFKGWASLLMQERYQASRPMSTEVVLDILEKTKERKETQESGSSQRKGKGKGKSIQVRQLADQIHAEVPELNFDYFALHEACWALLKKLKLGFEQVAGPGAMAIVIPQEDKLPHLVGYVFSGMKTPDGAPVPQSVVWRMAVDAVGEGLAQGDIGRRIAEAAAAPVDARTDVRIALGGLDVDPWKLKSGNLVEFVLGQVDNCPVQ
ncbi:hypothetical protein PG991_001561 [Apiospora marii]|uniref:DUF6604 domain-containing protein n=1 Tax=Apiospora marii TaxID=335849 RepID=A0ABR1SRT5_9PEZI